MKIDINCDLGEGIGNDIFIMPLISSCNIACGGHTGDAKSMKETLILAKKHHVKIGAHPSYPDKENFGRKVLNIDTAVLIESVYNQIINLKIEADKLKLKIHHIKPHGALYNLAVKDKKTAKAIINAIKKTDLNICLYAPFNSVLADTAIKENIPIVYEAFMDRRYNNDLTLVSRLFDNAVISNPKEVFEQLFNIVLHQKVISITNQEIKIKADTYCIHGDNVNAISILKNLHIWCKENQITIN